MDASSTFVGAIVLAAWILLEYTEWYDLLVSGILMVTVIILVHPKIKFLKSKEILNIFEWNEHFKGRDRGTIRERPTGDLRTS